MPTKIYNAPIFENPGRGRPARYNLDPFDVGDYVVIPKHHVAGQRNRVAHLNNTDLVGRRFQVVQLDENRWAIQRVS